MGRPSITTPQPVQLPEHELLARVFRTLSDPTRLRLLDELRHVDDASQVDLIERVGVTQSRASEHLTCLAWSGLVAVERRGRTARYRLADDRAEVFLRIAREFVTDNDQAVGSCTVAPDLEDDRRPLRA